MSIFPRKFVLALLTAAVVPFAWPGGGARAQKVPDLVVGPGAADAAAPVEARIAEVTVFSDRARIRRRGRVPAGARLARFPDLPGATFLDTVRVAALGGARVLRVEATPVERERLAIAEASKLLDQLDAANDRLVELEDRARLDQWEVDLLTHLAPAPLVPEEKREGHRGPPLDAASWWRALDFVTDRGESTRARLARLVDERRELVDRRDEVRVQIERLNQGGFSHRVVQVLAVIEPAASDAPVVLQLEYFLPGARWKPVYDLRFAPGRGQLRLDTSATVVQATGEDWADAALSFSTAIPGRGIDLPELLSWTLGESGEFLPQLRARTPPPMAAELPLPVVSSSLGSAHALQTELVRRRLVFANLEASTILAGGLGPKANGIEIHAEPIMAAPAPPPASPLPAPAQPSPERPVHDAEDSAGDRDGSPEPSALGQPLAQLSAEVGGYRDMISQSKRSLSEGRPTIVALALAEPATARRGPVFGDPYLPAVSAGGLDYVYRCPTPASVPSSSKEIRIPLASQTFSTTAFYQATPALDATAFLRARARNDGKRPFLRGPAAIFSDGDLVGQGELQTTGPGGDIDFPLGADQDVRLVRQVVPSTKITGLIMKSEETTYDVQIQVGNYKKRAAVVEVIDQLPKSTRGNVEVKLLGVDPALVGPPDADGVVRWRLELPAGATRTLRLRYLIVRPKDWTLYQR
jgi:hypothetical protein